MMRKDVRVHGPWTIRTGQAVENFADGVVQSEAGRLPRKSTRVAMVEVVKKKGKRLRNTGRHTIP